MKLEGTLFITDQTKQGEIKEKINDCFYMVSFFSWVSGATTHNEIVSLFDMANWKLFPNDELFQKAASKIGTEQTQ